ncbi:MAG: helix-turn-helix domain-containing protein [Deltaproteobacteria bacterium]|nr:helix-turn-helix domain-containing protein [Deltaproteobacteria bacterium]
MANSNEAKRFGRLLTLKQAAAQLGVSWWTLGRWARQGRFRTVRLGSRRLVPESELSRLVESNMTEASAPAELRMV